MKEFGIVHQAWDPFSEGIDNLFKNPILVKIADEYSKYRQGNFKMAYR